MRPVIQRVAQASIAVEGKAVTAAGPGLVVLLGVAEGDTAADSEKLAYKVARLRVFPDDAGRFDRSLLDVGGEALVVSQFTLYGDSSRGNRPSMSAAARP